MWTSSSAMESHNSELLCQENWLNKEVAPFVSIDYIDGTKWANGCQCGYEVGHYQQVEETVGGVLHNLQMTCMHATQQPCKSHDFIYDSFDVLRTLVSSMSQSMLV